jgi:PAS domain S-box-containing protein
MTHADRNLALCEQEPIHAPGCIQPHGALLVLDPDSWAVTQASANCPQVFGPAADALLGRPIAEALGPVLAAGLRAGGLADEPQPLGKPLTLPCGVTLHATAHRRDGKVVLELEPGGDPPEPGWHATTAVAQAAHRLAQTGGVDGLARAICAEVRALTGYDRVMVYRFEPDWTGTVVAEERRPDQEPYLGLYYPESDIPAQARRLYLETRVRVIPDTGYRPVPLVPAGRPADLGRAALRSVSPNCLEFMRNMGVGASFGLSLLVRGRLWGLVIGHHPGPRPVPPPVRVACDLLGQVASLQLTGRLADEDALGREVGRRLADLAVPAVTDGIDDAGRELAAVTGAAGVAVWRGGLVTTAGATPPADVIRGLVAWVSRRSDDSVVATDRLAADFPPAADHADTAGGLLALTVTRDPDLVVLWFRPRAPRQVRWGGPPGKTSRPSPTGYGTRPRTSFAPWEQVLLDRSDPWTPANRDAALHLRQGVWLAEARRAERMARKAAASDALFRTAFDHSGAGMVLATPDGTVVRANPAFARLVGRREGELTGTPYAALVHPDDRAAGVAARRRLLDGGGESFQIAKRFRHRTGRSVFALVTASLVRTPEGRPELFVFQVQDVTERTWGERLLAAEKAAVGLLAGHPDPAGLIGPLLVALGETLGYDRADYWQPGDAGPVRADGWAAAGAPAAGPGPGPGVARAFAAGGPAVEADGLAVPVAVAGRLVGVVALSAPGPEAVPDGPGLRAFAPTLAATLGRYLDHQAAEAALRASEARFQAFLAHLPHPAWVKDEAGRYAAANPAFKALFLPARDGVTDRTDADLFPPPVAAALRRHDRGVIESGRPLAAEVEVPGPTGPRAYMMVKFPFPGPDGGRAVGGVAVDLTDRVAAERQAVAATRLMRTIIDSAAGPISARDRDHRYLLVNRFLADLYGTAPGAVVGVPVAALLGPEAGRRAAAQDLEAVATGRPLTYEETAPDPAGRPRTWLTTTTPLPGGPGEPDAVGTVSVSVEITGRKAAEDALREQSARLAEQHRLAALRAEVGLAVNRDAPLPDVLRAGCDAVLAYLGAAFVRVWTLNEADQTLELQASVGMYTHTDGPHARVRVGELKIGRIAAARTPHLTNDVAADPNVGDPAWAAREGMAAFAGHPLVCGDRLVGVLALFARSPLSAAVLDALGSTADLLALGVVRKRAEDALKAAVRVMDEARAAADAANRAKTEFLANVSHELRTPLGGVLGMTELMLADTLPPTQRDRLTVVQESAERLRDLVNDLLDVAKIDAGKMELGAVPFDPRAAVQSALAPLVFQARRKGLAVDVTFAPGVPRAVVGDPHRLAQVLVNLFGNAVKFTERGGVTATVGGRPAGADFELEFEVRDTGIGIPTDKLGAVFEPFVQADPGVARRYGGTGLGLAIARRLVALMGGRLGIESEVGRGTTFRCEVRVGVAADPRPDGPRPPALPAAGRPLSVLLADDQPINLRVVGDMLRKAGHKVTTAGDGLEVVEATRRERFDVVLMDVQMPGTDGLRATALIRAREAGTADRLPIIALTARAMPEDRDECLRAGMDDIVTKPIEWPALFRAVAAVTGPRPGGDADPLLARFGGDAGLLADVLAIFAADAPGLVAEVRAAVESGAAAAVAGAAHKLVGLAGNLDAAEVVAAARGIEEAGRRGDLAGAADGLARLDAAMAAFGPRVARLREACRGPE